MQHRKQWGWSSQEVGNGRNNDFGFSLLIDHCVDLVVLRMRSEELPMRR
jgi:hypothetical protein